MRLNYIMSGAGPNMLRPGPLGMALSAATLAVVLLPGRASAQATGVAL
jgi:hypothetical protein